MATFGQMINLQPSILNWIVNGENSDLAFREVVSSKAAGNNNVKNTYRGNVTEFLNNYMIPSLRTFESGYGTFNGTSSILTFPDDIVGSHFSFSTDILITQDDIDTVASQSGKFNLFQISAQTDAFSVSFSGATTGSPILVPTISGAVDAGDFYDINTTPLDLTAYLGTWFTVTATTNYTGGNTVLTLSVGTTDYTDTLAAKELSFTDGEATVGALDFKGSTQDVFSGEMRNVAYTNLATAEEIIIVADPYTGINTGTGSDLVPTDIAPVQVASGVDYYPDRDPYFKTLTKGRILNSLLEYKSRWNINEDSAKLKIDHVSIKGDWLVVKTTEPTTEAPVSFGVFNSTTSQLALPNLTFSGGSNLDGELNISLEAKFSAADLSAINDKGYANIIYNNSTPLTGMEFSPNSYVDGVLNVDFYGQIFGSTSLSTTASIDILPDVWYTYRLTAIDNVGGSSVRLYVDDVQESFNTNAGAVGISASLDTYYMGYITDPSEALPCSMKNVLITTQGGAVTLVSIADPSTGVNTGIGSDGVPTDITQGTI